MRLKNIFDLNSFDLVHILTKFKMLSYWLFMVGFLA